MATPIIQTNGSVSGLGTAGVSRNDMDATETVSLTDAEAANSGATYLWTLEDIPFGSATTMTNPTTATPEFVVDIVGSYRIKCLVNGSDTSQLIVSVPLANTGARIPSTGETTEYNAGGNTEGWAEAQDFWMRAVDAVLVGVTDVNVKVSGNDSTAGLLGTKLVAGTNVALVEQNDGGNETLRVDASEPANTLHDDVANEFDITQKGSPVNTDRILLEDSADSFNKKYVEVGDLPSVSSADALSTTGADVVINTAAPPTTGQILKATSATTATWQTDDDTPSGAAGGDLGGTYPNPDVDALNTTGASVNVSAAAPPTTGQALTATSATTATWQTVATTDVAVEVSGDDTTPGDLESKIAAGTNVAIATLNPAGNEQLEISVASAAPSGTAGGDLAGSYPNPTVEAVGTTGTAVNVGLAAPPTTGQVLQATSATTATWQTISSGGAGSDTTAIHDDTAGEITAVTAKANLGLDDVLLIEDSSDSDNKKSTTIGNVLGASPAIPGNASFILAKPSGNPVYSSGGTISFDTIMEQAGSSVSYSSGTFTVKAGRTYELTASGRINHTGGAQFSSQWYNVTTATSVGNLTRMQTATVGTDIGAQPIAKYIFRPDVDTDIELRWAAGGTSGSTLSGNFTYASVVELTANPPGQFAQGDYMRVELAANQADPVATTIIGWDTVTGSRGGLTLNGSGHIVGLKAGRTYDCDWQVVVNSRGGADANGSIVCRLRDVTSGSLLGTSNTVSSSIGDRQNTISLGSQTSQTFTVTPTVDTTVAIEVSGVVDTGGIDAAASGSYFSISEIGATAPTAQGELIRVEMSADQVGVSALDFVDFDTVNVARGGLGLNGLGQVTGLRAGRTYQVIWQTNVVANAVNESFQTELYDVTNAQVIGTSKTKTFSFRHASNTSSNADATMQSWPFVPTSANTTIGIRVSSVSGTTDIEDFTSFLQVIEIGTAAPPVIGGLEFLDRIEVTGSAATSVTFSSSGDGDRQHDVNGDIDENYVLISRIKKANSASFQLRPNALTSDQFGAISSLDNSAETYSAPTNINIGGSASVFDQFHTTVQVYARTGFPRAFDVRTIDMDFGGPDCRLRQGAVMWDDDSTNITSLEIFATTALGIDVGSTFELYRITSKTTENFLKLQDTKTAAYTVKSTDQYVPYDPSGGAFSITLFSGGASNKGQEIRFKNKSNSTNQLTLTAAAGQTIDGAATLPLTGSREAVLLVFDGVSDWEIN